MGKTNFWAVIEPKDIQDGNILSVLTTIRELDRREAEGEDVFRSLTIAFRGFDDDDKELWDIPEVRDWTHKLINRVPYLFYYVENDVNQTEQTLMLCMNEVQYIQKTDHDNAEHLLSFKIHQKSYREMCSELRKFARQRNKKTSMETVIAEMNQRYGGNA